MGQKGRGYEIQLTIQSRPPTTPGDGPDAKFTERDANTSMQLAGCHPRRNLQWSKLQHARDQTASDFETRTQAPMSKTGHRTNDWTSSEKPALRAASRRAFTAGVVQ